ncbi:MAG: penicillin-binding protein activator [Proteobacteria bacterium]|nr:penicillin-binding protein activator [Pseudomonadota bacterium]
MLRRAFVLLAATVALAACAGTGGMPGGGGQVTSLTTGAAANARGGKQVSILLPLSGANADVGQPMLKAAQLALAGPGSPALTVRDTGSTPEGAAAAARAAVAAGDAMILGPLTSAETGAVATIAQAAQIPVLAFTNDPAQARPGVWPLGITPVQQVRRLVGAAQEQGKNTFAGLLPDNALGHAMGAALAEVAGGSQVRYYAQGMSSINAATREISGYASRGGLIDAQIKAARALDTPEGRKQAQELVRQRQSIPPAPFDSLLLGDTGIALSEIASLLPYYDVPTGPGRVLGPALWSLPNSGASALPGAWYAAPDPAARTGFDQAFTAKYGSPAPPLADLAFDAAAIARALDTRQGVSVAALTQPQGFAGSDGLIILLPDGHVRRGLAVFEMQRGGPQIIAPAPSSPGAPGV